MSNINTENIKINPSLIDKLNYLPLTPGIYQFKDKKGKIIYVGKAKNLKNRVKSYFLNRPLGPRLQKMVSLINDIDIITTDSEVESLILEMNLIKELKPRYNVNLKDDKSFPYIVITKEPYPRIFPTRRRKNDGSKYIGPFTDVGSMKYSLKMVRDLFMVRTCNLNITDDSIRKKKFKVCLEYHIKKCEGPCEGLVSKEKYNEMIDEAEKILQGKTSALIKELEKKMNFAAFNQMYEEAAVLRNKIQSLKVYSEKQKIVSDDFLDKDIINFYKEDDDACAMVLNVRDGKVIGKRHFYLSSVDEMNDADILENVIYRYYSENAYIPDEIHLPENAANDEFNLDLFKEFFNKKFNKQVQFIIPKRGEKVQLLAMVKTNAKFMLDELKIQKLKREFIPNSINALKRDLRLSKLPRRIECYDISNIQGTDTVASMVVFKDGKPFKSDYRKFKINTVLNQVGKPDDFASMREVIYRRFRKIAEKNNISVPDLNINNSNSNQDPSFDSLPDLIVIDGGKGQLSSAVKVLNDLGLKNQNIISLAKRLEEVFIPNVSEAQSIPKTSSSLKLLQRVRNEAHRFAVTFHRELRTKRTLVSELESIKGIGKNSVKKLLNEFGSLENIKSLVKNNFQILQSKAGIKTAEKIKQWVENNS
jgi:excinuclease ABC subunit C